MTSFAVEERDLRHRGDRLRIRPRFGLSFLNNLMNTVHRVLAVVAASSAASLLAGEWPQYRGAAGDGTTPELLGWKSGSLKQVWKVPADSGFSSFTVSGGKAYTQVLREVDGAKQETLVALDAATGKELWKAVLSPVKYDGGGEAGTKENNGGDGPRSTPTVSGGLVLVLSSALNLAAFDAATGKQQWSKDLVAQYKGRNIRWQNAASPLVDNGVVYVAGGGAGESLLAFRLKDGSELWKKHDELMTHATPTAATIGGERQIVFFLQSGLLAVNPSTGDELWRYAFPFKISTAASPVVGGDIVYCSAGYGVGGGAVKVENKAGKWSATEIYRVTGDKQIANHWSTPVVKDGHLYGMFQFKQYGAGPLKCVDLKTGQVKWEKEGFGPGNVILAGGRILALSDAGELVLAEAVPTGYKEVARQKVLDGKCWSTPVLADGRIYVRSTKEAASFATK